MEFVWIFAAIFFVLWVISISIIMDTCRQILDRLNIISHLVSQLVREKP